MPTPDDDLVALPPAQPKTPLVTGVSVVIGKRTKPNALFQATRDTLAPRFPQLRDVRPGDVRHSPADSDTARTRLGYASRHRLGDGLAEAMECSVGDLGGCHAR